jgi:hypothetical protein
MNDLLEGDLQTAADLPFVRLLQFQGSAEILGVYCFLVKDKFDNDCVKVKKIISLMRFERERRQIIEQSIFVLNKARKISTEERVRAAEQFIFYFGTDKERDRVAF